MFSIGEFSTVSGIPVRTLRFYHEVGLLVPASVDSQTNYRRYDERNLEMAKVIVALRSSLRWKKSVRSSPIAATTPISSVNWNAKGNR